LNRITAEQNYKLSLNRITAEVLEKRKKIWRHSDDVFSVT